MMIRRITWAERFARTQARGRAHYEVSKAIASGLLSRPSLCEEASGECRGPIEAAHYTYAAEDRLRVRWLCHRHHVAWDKARRDEFRTLAGHSAMTHCYDD